MGMLLGVLPNTLGVAVAAPEGRDVALAAAAATIGVAVVVALAFLLAVVVVAEMLQACAALWCFGEMLNPVSNIRSPAKELLPNATA